MFARGGELSTRARLDPDGWLVRLDQRSCTQPIQRRPGRVKHRTRAWSWKRKTARLRAP